MYYAKSTPVETIKEHTENLLKNLKLLRKVYGKEIVKAIKIVEERFWMLLEIVCIYHDIGKVYTPFQNKILNKLGKPEIKTQFSYETIKHEQISPMFVPVEKYNLTQEEKILVYQAIYYHHERDNKEINKEYVNKIIEEDLKPKIEEIEKEIGYDIEKDLNSRYIRFINKRITDSDKLYTEYCLIKGLLHRLDHSSSANLQVEDDTLENITEFIDEFITTKNSKPNELQEFCRKNKNENLVIIGSTGVGKTESALYWSNGKKVFFTLPLRTSINAMYDRIQDTIGYKHTGLLHSTALEYLEEKEEFENEEQKYNQSKNLCEKITICTIDQIFPFVFKYKGYEKMYSTLSYSKVIIDEVQAYSPEIVAIILKGLEMINKIGGKFMLMTATLPRIYKEELERKGISFKYDQYLKPIKRHKIKLEEKEIVKDIEEMNKKSKDSKVLVIVNTVNKAIEMYLKLKEQGTENVNLLHSRFIYNDRSGKEKEIKDFSNKKDKKGIWITTQIVEASIDIDFDYLYTEMSTLDSLFQRLGRCYRNRQYEKEEENIHIYTKNASGIKYIYDEEINRKSIELLEKYDEKILEEDIKVELVDKLYSKEILSGTKFWDNFKSGLKSLEGILDYKTSRKVAQKLLRNIENISVIPKTIYEQNLELFREYSNENQDYKRKNALRRQLDKLTISITESSRWKMQDRLTVNPYYDQTFIADLKYDSEIGLVLEKDEEYESKERML